MQQHKMVYPYRIVPLLDAKNPPPWPGLAQYPDVSLAHDAVSDYDMWSAYRAEFALARAPDDALWTDILTREGYEHDRWYGAGYGLARFRLPDAFPAECTTPQDRESFQRGYEAGLASPPIPRSRNIAYGFYGSWQLRVAGRTDPDAQPEFANLPPPSVAWITYVDAYRDIVPAPMSDDALRDQLDSNRGRHICEGILDRMHHGDEWPHAITQFLIHCG